MYWTKTCLVALLAALLTGSAQADKVESKVSGDQALKTLLAANKRYVAGKSIGPNRQVKRRTELARGQHPYAVVVCCSDSRVPPEILFDQGLGDLFVIRLAGNIINDAALGSIEYAVAKLGARLIFVLGHSDCGAVAATVKGDPVPGHIGVIVEAISPAVERARSQPGKLLDNAIKENAREIVTKLKTSSPILAEQVKSGQLKVVGGVYELQSGKVLLLH